MSLIGPRPLAVKYLPYYNEYEMHRHDVRPGLMIVTNKNKTIRIIVIAVTFGILNTAKNDFPTGIVFLQW